MAGFFASGRVVDLVLLVLIGEGAAILGYHAVTRRGIPPIAVVTSLAPGAALLIALRQALLGGWWGWMALSLLAAFAGNLLDLRTRWRS